MNEINFTKNIREFYNEGLTQTIKYRIHQLNKLEEAILQYEDKILEALKKDLNKSSYEAYMTEIGTVLMEINFVRKRLIKWMKPKKVKTPLSLFPGKSVTYFEPLGVVLIISPWNYPFQLAIMPLVGAIAAGNCAMIKPSEYSTHTSEVVKDLIESTFGSNYIQVVMGGKEESTALLQEKFDLIFFTGSPEVGKVIMEAASKHLTPVVLELGGKSPCIVEASADIKLAAKRILWGKMLNAGQTCVAPDYVLVQKDVKEALLQEMKEVLNQYYAENTYDLLPKIISPRHFNRLKQLLENETILMGGKVDETHQQISATLVEGSWDCPIMKEEIFGPILPILTFEKIEELIEKVNAQPKPLALYLFTNQKQVSKKVLKEIPFGGGCINDTIMHLATPFLPFGGVGNSGMGAYHGKTSFDAFSHQKSVLMKSRHLDLAFRYPPFNKKLNFLKRFMK